MFKKDKTKILIELFLCFFKIGCFTFGGGFAMIPLIEREIVTNKKWVTEEEVIDVFAVSQSLPGAIAINTSTFIGYKIIGRLGAIAATAGVVLPSVIIITLIAMFFSIFNNNPVFEAVFSGIRPAIVSLILVAGLKIGKSSVKDKIGVIIMLTTLALVTVFDVHAIIAVVGGALTGIIIYNFFPKVSEKIVNGDGDKK
ncbi:MAG: Chromate transporter [Clostridiales bacterium]|jgi:chromate transporter|nr:Chromate transporter [Clostridiales bacterium]